MTKAITITVRMDDVEPVLREAARDAAMYGALCDYMTKRTGNRPTGYGELLEDARKRWQAKFLRAKRIVEAFGVEYEPTSEQETLTVDFPWVGGKRKLVANLFYEVSGQTQDFKRPFPSYRREVHQEACRQAADRVVRRWQAQQAGAIAA